MKDEPAERKEQTVRFVVNDESASIEGQRTDEWLRSDSVIVLADWR